MSCPYCRQRITLLLPYFSDEERNVAEPEDIQKKNRILSEVTDYNKRFSGEPRSIIEHVRDLPVLLRHLRRYFWSAEVTKMNNLRKQI